MPETTRRSVKRVTTADVARAVGVSRATVGFVLNQTPGQTISEATRGRVLAAATELGYRPNEAARRLASGRTKIVLFVLPDWPLEHSMRSNIEAASAALDSAGYTLVTYTPHQNGSRPLWEVLVPDVVIGMMPFSAEQASSMRTAGVELIVPEPGVVAPAASEQGFGQGPALQLRHLYDLGHRRVAYAVTGDPRLRTLTEERVTGARRAAKTLGIELGPIHTIDDPQGAIAAWLTAECTAVAAYNDEVAAAVVGAAIRQGVSVPDQFSIVGHDDSPIAQLLVPSLTTVRLDNRRLGQFLAELALAAIAGTPPRQAPDDVATLIVRESTGTRSVDG
ncbi:LacI family DNA-binding transcriptional regulator [Curtobacterium flaccumfaciens]|uniref:LacI family DNA-binding transcriptional regulator n=1 Tax=Curtobacterium flaccumfaciens TaxID=2035 RepID=UPI001E5D2769|nr:LacI family DNA-binding transcriptional regulator [Curtobacterium allii]MCE0459739.1 LacI family transcriptional regulator [Curtobacterium allii]